MNLIGDTLYLPLIDAVLQDNLDVQLCNGIGIHALTDDYRVTIRANEAIAGRYSESIDHMQVALAITPEILLPESKPSLHELQSVAIFVAMLIRLTTGIPLDIPWWIDAKGDDIQNFGNTRVRTFRTGKRYQYPLDRGTQDVNLQLLGGRLDGLVDSYVGERSKNRVLRAAEFAFIGFQTFHIPTRLVNHVTYLETLFSTSNTEIAHQLSSRIAWYLASADEAERERLFYVVKKIYAARSRIVHGSSFAGKEPEMREHLESVEDLNSKVFAKILSANHVATFSSRDKPRINELQKLGLGISSEFS